MYGSAFLEVPAPAVALAPALVRRIGLWLWLWLGIRLRRRIWLWWRRIWVSGRFGRGLRDCRRRIVTAARRENAADANGA